MANPQTENGYTKLANEVLEAVQQFKFNVNEMKILMCLWRFTYGFQRKEHHMSLSFFEKHTGLTRGRLNKSLKDLRDNNVIFIQKGDAKTSNIYSFNKNYEGWNKEKYSSFCSSQDETSEQSEPSVRDDIATSSQNGTATSVRDDTATSSQNDTQERKYKDNYKEIDEDEEDTHAGHVFQFYENNFGGTMTDYHRDFLGGWCDDLSPDVVIESLKITLLNNATSLKYTSRILNEWVNNNLHHLSDVQRYEKEKNEKKEAATRGQNQGSYGKPPPSSGASQERSITGDQLGWIKPGKQA